MVTRTLPLVHSAPQRGGLTCEGVDRRGGPPPGAGCDTADCRGVPGAATGGRSVRAHPPHARCVDRRRHDPDRTAESGEAASGAASGAMKDGAAANGVPGSASASGIVAAATVKVISS